MWGLWKFNRSYFFLEKWVILWLPPFKWAWDADKRCLGSYCMWCIWDYRQRIPLIRDPDCRKLIIAHLFLAIFYHCTPVPSNICSFSVSFLPPDYLCLWVSYVLPLLCSYYWCCFVLLTLLGCSWSTFSLVSFFPPSIFPNFLNFPLLYVTKLRITGS